MLIALSIINSVLAVAFLGAGINKLARSRQALLAGGMGWVEDVPDGRVKLVGTLEVLGAIGLTLPLLTGVLPILAPQAAVGLVALLIGAISTHTRRHEQYVPAGVLMVLAVASAIIGLRVVLG